MTDIDRLLSMIENPTRRRILEALAVEPHYPLQLSKKLGVSQQAVMKNLALMEQNGMVTSYRVESNMGPMRTLYVPNEDFTLVIDMHTCTFRTTLITAPDDEGESLENHGCRDGEGPLEDYYCYDEEVYIGKLDSEIERLDRKRAQLVKERDMLVESLMKRIREEKGMLPKGDDDPDWQDRKEENRNDQ